MYSFRVQDSENLSGQSAGTLFSSETMEQLKRILSESWQNASRHGRATRISIDMRTSETELILEILDNGIGFDTDAEITAGHYGIQGMKERAALLGGSVVISSSRGSGTGILIQVPGYREE